MHHKLFHQESLPNTVCTSLRHALSGSQGGLVGLLLRSVRVFEQVVRLLDDS